jgi:hypothetical protein
VLDGRDQGELGFEVTGEVYRCRALVADLSAVIPALTKSLMSATPERRQDALCRFEIAKRGLLLDHESREVAVAPALLAFCRALPFDLKPFLAPSMTIETRGLEASAALEWLLESVALGDAEEKIIVGAMRRCGIRREKMPFLGALSRAQAEFRRSIGHEYSYGDAVIQVLHLMQEEHV